MITQAFIKNPKYQKSLDIITSKNKLNLELSQSYSDFKSDILKRRPGLFFIEADCLNLLEAIHLINDVRAIFGLISTIIILGDNVSRIKLVDYLASGADQFFSFPFDEALIEDFLSKRTNSEYCQAFKYRNIPSRTADISLTINLQAIEINTKGVVFKSSFLIKNGTRMDFKLSDVIAELKFDVVLKVVSTDLVDDNLFIIRTHFTEISDDKLNQIFSALRKN